MLTPEEFIKLLRNTPEHIPCFVDQLELYRPDECTKLNQIRRCLAEFTQANEWGKSPPKSFLKVIESATAKDYVFPSDSILRRLREFEGEKYFPKCFYKIFSEIQYCQLPCAKCN